MQNFPAAVWDIQQISYQYNDTIEVFHLSWGILPSQQGRQPTKHMCCLFTYSDLAHSVTAL